MPAQEDLTQSDQAVNGVMMTKRTISATGDGGCLFNAIAIGLAAEIRSGRLDKRQDDQGYQDLLYEFSSHAPSFDPKTWENLKVWLTHYSHPKDTEKLLTPVLFRLHEKYANTDKTWDDKVLQEIVNLVWKNNVSIGEGRQWYEMTVAEVINSVNVALCPTLDNLELNVRNNLLAWLRAALSGPNVPIGDFTRERAKEFVLHGGFVSKIKGNLENNEALRERRFREGYSIGAVQLLANALSLQLEKPASEDVNQKTRLFIVNTGTHWDVELEENDCVVLHGLEPLIQLQNQNVLHGIPTVQNPPKPSAPLAEQFIPVPAEQPKEAASLAVNSAHEVQTQSQPVSAVQTQNEAEITPRVNPAVSTAAQEQTVGINLQSIPSATQTLSSHNNTPAVSTLLEQETKIAAWPPKTTTRQYLDAKGEVISEHRTGKDLPAKQKVQDMRAKQDPALHEEELTNELVDSTIPPNHNVPIVKSCFTLDQIGRIMKLIDVLDKEIKSRWPFPNKDRKAIKRDGLKALLKAGETTGTVVEAIAQIENNLDYQDLRTGKISHRVRDLLDDLKSEARLDPVPGPK